LAICKSKNIGHIDLMEKNKKLGINLMEKVKKIEKKILKRSIEVIEKKLISEGDKVLIAFSGGPDSVFLYNFLKFLKSRILMEISLVYVNHNLRTDVENDLEFVKKFASENDVDCYIQSVDVKKYSKENKKSLELAARELRYEAIEEVRKNIGYNKIATGHNMDDNVETFIFRLLRGTSMNGLKGIPEVRENIVRPILGFEKSEILYFLKSRNWEYLVDYTNNENDYTRNFIRNEIFPCFERVNPDFRRKVESLIVEINERNFAGAEKFENEKNLEEKSFEIIKKNEVNQKDELSFLLKKNNVQVSREKIDQIFRSFFNKNGELKNAGTKEFYLGENKILQNVYGKLEIVKILNRNTKEDLESDKNRILSDKTIILKENQSIKWYNYKITLYENIENFKKDENAEYAIFKIDDRIENGEFFLRNRKDGDRISLKNLGHKKVKKILIDEKVPKGERDFVPIVGVKVSRVQNNLEFSSDDVKLENGNTNEVTEILAISDIKFSKFLEKIQENEIEKEIKKLGNGSKSKLLVIGRKNGRER
jgi:tRNA(ile)-lysidine synthase